MHGTNQGNKHRSSTPLSCLSFPGPRRTPSERGINDTIRHNLYYQTIISNIFNTVGNCQVGAGNCSSFKRNRHPEQVPASAPLEFIVTDILAPMLKPKTGIQSPITINDLCVKLTRTIPAWKTTAIHIASILFDHWLVAYRVPTFHLTDNGSHFVSRLSETLCTFHRSPFHTSFIVLPNTNAIWIYL